MAQKAQNTNKHRLNLVINDQVLQRLESLVDKTESETKTEVIRRALAVYEHLWHEKQNSGAELTLSFPDGTEKKLVLL